MLRAIPLIAGLLLPLAAQAVEVDALRSAYVFSPRAPDPRALWCPFLANAHCPVPSLDVTTTRASTCMSYDGSTWTTQPADTACVGRHGLEAFGAFTNYVSNSALPEGFQSRNGAVLDPGPDGQGVRVTASNAETNAGAESASFVSATAGQTWTATCEARTVSGNNRLMIFMPSGGSCFHDMTTTFERYSCTRTLTVDAGTLRAYCWLLSTSGAGVYDVRQAQLTRTAAPMPRHDCDDAACTRAADVHTVSTEGWPTSSLDVRLQYTPSAWPPSGNQVLLHTSGVYATLQADGNFILRVNGTTVGFGVASVMSGANVRDYRVRFNGSQWTICAGASCSSAAGATPNPHGTATIGNVNTGGQPANGSIRLLRVSE